MSEPEHDHPSMGPCDYSCAPYREAKRAPQTPWAKAEATIAQVAAERDAALGEVERLRAALAELIPFTEEMVDGAYRPADVPIMLAWPPLEQARRALEGRPS